MLKKAIAILLGLFIILDLVHSYHQYLYMSLDGDVADNVVPAPAFQQVLKDPIGWAAVTQGKKSGGVNRFFAHWSMYEYMRHAPLFFQNFSAPIDSVYIAGAVFRLLTQILLLYLLGVYVTRAFNPFRFDFLLACALMLPFFQVNYYAIYMAIIHQSITYTFFYAFALCAVLAFFLPFYLALRWGGTFPWWIHVLLLAGIFVLAFNGPIVPPVCVLIILLTVWYKMRTIPSHTDSTFAAKWMFAIRSLPGYFRFYFFFLILLSFYSLYVGTYNSDSYVSQLPLGERYANLPEGIYNMLTQKLGFPLLFLALGINVFILRRYFMNAEGRQITAILGYIGVFALIYILLLPLGGYRVYRPNIIRHDTAMPITIALIFFYARSSLFILGQLKATGLKLYIILLVGFAVVFTIADIDVEKNNLCERESIAKIASSSQDAVQLDTTCTVLSWGIIRDPKYSDVNGEMLRVWRITDRKKFYYQK